MQTFNSPIKNNKTILALGAESAGNFSIHLPLSCTQGRAGEGSRGLIYFSEDFGDLLEEQNWLTFQKTVLDFLKENQIKPEIILTDLHPLMKTTLWGQELSKKYKAKFIQVQHHHAHIFSAIGDSLLSLPFFKGDVGRGLSQNKNYKLPTTSYGLVMDGTGFGTDEHIWGGECFAISNFQVPSSKQFSNINYKISKQKIKIEHIGSLENQILIGGELAIKEPARVLLSILNKFLDKNTIYPYMATYYSKNEFELLHNQLEQNFNCLETSSTGRILDAVSLLLGFCKNERKYKHEPIDLLEKNSTKPYKHPLPLLEGEMSGGQRGCYTLNTTTLFKYLINNLHKDKKRLAATAQLYLTQGLYEIIQKHINHSFHLSKGEMSEGRRGLCHPELDSGSLSIFASGGITNNKIISDYFTSKKIYINNTIPRGDAGLSLGQIIYYLF